MICFGQDVDGGSFPGGAKFGDRSIKTVGITPSATFSHSEDRSLLEGQGGKRTLLLVIHTVRGDRAHGRLYSYTALYTSTHLIDMEKAHDRVHIFRFGEC